MSTSTNSSSGSPAARTLLFVGAAVVCVGITAAIEIASRPAAIEEFGQVGEEFYPDFTDPTLAAGLEVYAFDTEEVVPQEFIVKRQANGQWTIPSRHDYPADAEDQLSKTAASIIGIKRGAMVSRWPADHARYGVVNPKQDTLKVDEVDGVGKRLILTADDGSTLADYIIGKPVDSDSVAGSADQYYVRHPEKDDVYICSMTIDLSTKFSDWIDTDLLHINTQSDITQLAINDYSFDGREVTPVETTILKREKSSDPWVLEGLNEETEEVDTTAMSDAVGAIADMKIVGVRPKQDGLTPDLQIDPQVIQTREDIGRLQGRLMAKGFALDGQSNALRLLAHEGELFASTKDGLTFRMYFGRAFTGSQEELEFELSDDSTESSSNADESESQDETGDSDADSSEDTADGATSTDEESAEEETNNGQPGRYVFVRVDFVEGNLGERPMEPVAPEMPEELKQADESDDAEKKEEDAEPATDGESESTENADESEQPEEDPLAEVRQTYEAAKAKYEVDKRTYDQELKDLESKIEEGQKKAEEMNRRFSKWYYVVPGESFDKLRLSRQDVVKAKEIPEESATNEEEDQPKAEPEGNDPEADPAPTETADDSVSPSEKSDSAKETADPAPTEESTSEQTEESASDPEPQPAE